MTLSIEKEVRDWLDKVVIGLGLCPFAKKPATENRIRFVISETQNSEELLVELQSELEYLTANPAAETETTLLILPSLLGDFYEYNDFLGWADSLIQKMKWEGIFQIASFHPDYCFNDVRPEAAENLTNRSPYPILHILREASLSDALDSYPDAEKIPQRNIVRMESLSESEVQTLFSYL